MTCAECHLRIDGDVESCLLETFVERCLDGALAVDNDRVELAFPDGVPVGCRNQIRRMLDLESVAFQCAEIHLESLCVIKILLDVALQIRVLRTE